MKQNWEYKKLGDVATFINGYPFKPSEWTTEGLPIIRIQNLNNPFAEYNYFDKILDGRYIVKSGDVLISWSGTLGVYEWSGKQALLNQHIFKVLFDKGKINKAYFKYVVSSRIEEMKSKVHGITMQHITKGDFDKTTIPVPPIDEQQRIVAELDLLTEVIDKQKMQLKELDTLAQSIFHDMFGDPIENEKGWDIRPLERVVDATCTLSYGIVQTGDDVEDGVPVVRPIDMYSTYVTSLGLKKTTKEISDSYKRTILKGSELLLCIRGATGIVAMASIDLKGCNVGRNIVPISFSSCVIRDFAYYVFKTKSMFQEIQNKTHGIALQGINVKDVRLLPIILPPLALQQKFADKIQSIEKQKTAINQSIADTQKLLDYTMDKYFG